jgi:hypothetical protein
MPAKFSKTVAAASLLTGAMWIYFYLIGMKLSPEATAAAAGIALLACLIVRYLFSRYRQRRGPRANQIPSKQAAKHQ